jgi:type IV pilus assembly protein PilM
MLNNILSSENRILGLDIGSANIKMTEIRHSGNKKELVTYGVYSHNESLEGYWDSAKIEKFTKIIEAIRKNANFKTLKTVVALQAKYVFVTTMDFDSSWNKKMIQEEINRQAKYFLPYPPDEMKVSWNLVQTQNNVTSLTGKQRVIINALPNFVISNLTSLLNRCNLEGVAFENQTLSIARAILGGSKQNTILIDMGAASTTYSIIIDGTVRNSYTSNMGIKKLDESIASSLGINLEHAENFKKDLAFVNLFELPQEISSHLALVKSELKSFYQQNVKIAQVPQQVIITGGGTLTPGLIDFLKKDIPIPVIQSKIEVDLNLDDLKKLSFSPLESEFATAIGLALRA